MTSIDRRAFLRNSTALGVASLLSSGNDASAAAAKLAIAQAKASPKDPAGIAGQARRLTRAALESLGGMKRFVSRGDVVWVKPNIAWDRRPEQAANTNPDVVATLVTLCLEAGAKRVIVTDHTTHTAQRTFPRSGIQPAAEAAGAEVRFVDRRKLRRIPIKGKVLTEWEVYTEALEADKLINVPIVKHHGLTRATLGMKNLMGLIGGRRGGLHQDMDRTLPDLAAFFKPTLVVIDAIRVLVANGPTGGSLSDVRRKDTVAASVDQVAADAFAATLLDLRPQDVGHIVEAGARGLGKIDFESLGPKRVTV